MMTAIVRAPFWMGWEAYARGETIDQCPRRYRCGQRWEWIDGWEFGRLAFAASPERYD